MPLPMYSQKSAGDGRQIKNIIAVAAGKGGVGKSTLTVNLALALKKLGYKVGLMDTDIYGPSLRKMLPEEKLPSQQGDRIIPAQALGMPLISMAYFRREDEASVVRAPIANNIVTQFITNVAWGPLDYLLIDFPPGTGDIQLTLSQKAGLTGAIMITTPQEVAVMDVRKAMHMFGQVKVPIIGIVENMSYYSTGDCGERAYIFGQGGGKRLSDESSVPFLGEIPLDPQLCRSGDCGVSIFDGEENCRAISNIFLKIASNVADVCSGMADGTMRDFELSWKEMPSYE